MTPETGGFRLPLLVAAAGVAVDQWAKSWAEARLRYSGVTTVVDGLFDLRYSRNAGAFFSFGADWEPSFRRGFFIAASLLAMGLIVNVARSLAPDQRRLRWSMALLLAGATGNLIDRIRRGDVIDFLHLHAGERFHWATFNVADACIAVGLVLLALDVVRPGGSARATAAGQADAP